LSQAQTRKVEAETAAAKDRSSLIRTHLHKLVGDLRSCAPGTSVQAFREGNIVYKTYAGRIVGDSTNETLTSSSSGKTQQQQQKQQKDSGHQRASTSSSSYLQGLYAPPRSSGAQVLMATIR